MSDPQVSQDPSGLVEVEEKVVKWWHPLAMVLLLAGVFLLLEWTGLGSDLRSGDIAEMRQRIEAFGVLAPLAFVGIYTLATLIGFPGSPLTFAAGALFGSLIGIAASAIASTVAATLSFLIARYFARHLIKRWLAANRRFQQLDRLTLRHGALVVAVVRLVNLLPFFMVNYGFGLTRVPFKTYVLWSFLGKLPGTVALVLIGDAIYQAVIKGHVPWAMVGSVLGLLAALALVIRYLNRRLRESEAEDARERSIEKPTD